jgi:hypothetical protein
MLLSRDTDSSISRVRVIDITSVARPFALIKLANVTILPLAISSTVAFLDDLLGGRSIVANLLFMVPVALASWVSWRNVTVLKAVLQPLTVTSLLVLALMVGILGLAGLIEALMSPQRQEVDFSLVQVAALLVLSPLWLAEACAVLVLRGKRITDLGVSLKQFLRTVRSSHTGRKLKSKSPARGWTLIFLGSAILLFVDLTRGRISRGSIASLLVFEATLYLTPLAWLALLRARSQFEPSAETLLGSDPRPPVLLLRSFLDDELESYQAAEAALIDFSLESRLVEHFSGVGPFISVGSPKDGLTAIGAARATLSNEDWQGRVLGWMDSSAVILVMAGVTGWVSWEMRKIVEREHVNKLIVCIPNMRSLKQWSAREYERNLAMRFEGVRTAFAGTAWEPVLERLPEYRHIRTMIMEPGGGVTAVVSRSSNRNSYHLAVLVAHYLLGGCETHGAIKANSDGMAMAILRKTLCRHLPGGAVAIDRWLSDPRNEFHQIWLAFRDSQADLVPFVRIGAPFSVGADAVRLVEGFREALVNDPAFLAAVNLLRGEQTPWSRGAEVQDLSFDQLMSTLDACCRHASSMPGELQQLEARLAPSPVLLAGNGMPQDKESTVRPSGQAALREVPRGALRRPAGLTKQVSWSTWLLGIPSSPAAILRTPLIVLPIALLGAAFVACGVFLASFVIGSLWSGQLRYLPAQYIKTVLLFALETALLSAVLFGGHVFLELQRLAWVRWWACILSGFVIGALPVSIQSWPWKRTAAHVTVSVMRGGKMVQTSVNGVPTLAGWLDYAWSVLTYAALGALGGLVFWLIWRRVQPVLGRLPARG